MRRQHLSNQQVDDFRWHVLKQLFPYLAEYRGRIAIALLCLILTKFATVYMPFILKAVVDHLNSNGSNSLVIAPIALVLAYGGLRFASTLFAELRDTLFNKVSERAIRRIGLKVFEHLHALDLDFHLNRQTGGLSRDIERGTSGISFLMRFMVFNIIPTLIEIGLVIGVLLFNYGWSFALITLLSIVLYVMFSVIATNWRTGFIREANKADSASNSRAIDSLINYETVKYFNNEAFESHAYDQELASWEQAKTKNRLSLFVLNGGQALIISAAITAMLALASIEVAAKQMTLGDFVLINAFMMQLFMPLNFLGFVYREIKGSLANIEQMFTLLTTKAKITDAADAKPIQYEQGLICFKQVSFHYQPERAILKQVNFSVPSGQKVAVVGPSGSGKSTLIKLLFRFYDTTAGVIEIDGQDIKTVTQESLRRLIGIVPQDTVLFNDTLFENIRYGRPDATDAEVEHAIELAHLTAFIDDLPDKGNTLVGERGLKLSGGEKQRVAIARTLLKQPKIMVFDEATSSLDSRSEKAILTALKAVAQDHSSLVIAHRLSTIVDADNIIFMQQGQILEQGTHAALLAMGGHYAALWALQQQDSN